MTALKASVVDGFIAKAGGSAKAVLIYGADEGLVRERADALAKKITPDLRDAFNFIEFTEGEIKSDPPRLADELAALSLMGGRRVVRLRISGEGLPAPLKAALEGLDSGALETDSLLIVMAGALSKRSGLRKAFEAAKTAAAAPCYEDGAAGARKLADAALREAAIEADADTRTFIAATLGGDRMATRSELEKIVLYAGEGGRITLAEARALLTDSAPGAGEDAAALATAGDGARLARALDKARAAGAAPISLLRALVRRLDRLHTVKAALDAGTHMNEALRKLRPPLFFAEADAFKTDLRRWPEPALRRALSRAFDAERALKRTGAPQALIVEQTCLDIAALAAAPPPRRRRGA